MSPQLAADPVERFQKALSQFKSVPSSSISTSTVKAVIDDAQARQLNNGASVLDAVTAHVAQNSSLRVDVAKPIVKAALDKGGNSTDQAAAVGAAVSSLSGNVNMTFKDPVMLVPGARAVFAAVLAGLAGWSTLLTYWVAQTSSPAGVGVVCLFVMGLFCLVSLLVLVMGYKNVTITGSTGGSGSNGSK
jgi:hypothetical protein